MVRAGSRVREAGGSRRGWAPRLGSAALALGLTAGLSGCGQPQDTPPPLSLARDLPADTTLRLPASPPRDLEEAWLTSGNGIPLISFYSLNERMVTVCQAPREACQRLSPTAEVIPRADAADVTVLIEATEPGTALGLSDDLRRFWSEVPLVVGRPAWLGPADAPAAT